MSRIPSILKNLGSKRERKASVKNIFLLLMLSLFVLSIFTLGFVSAPKEIKVCVDSQVLHMKTSASTVVDALHQAGINLGQEDRITPGKDAQLKSGMTIKIERVKTKIETRQQLIPYGTERKESDSLEGGTSKIVQEGSNGVCVNTVKVTYVDGKAVKKQLLDKKITKQPVDKVVLVGARSASVTTSRGALRYKKVLTMNASAYAPDPRCGAGNGKRTAIGMAAGRGVVAVDPRVIPLRSRLFIEGYGFAVAGDTGGAIKGNKIDLGYGSYDEALRFGRRMVKVYILQ